MTLTSKEKMKSAIFNNLEEDQELSPEKLADQLFDNNLTARLTFVDELKEAIPEPISVSDIDHSRQIKNWRIKTIVIKWD